jgi:hypothetical protein
MHIAQGSTAHESHCRSSWHRPCARATTLIDDGKLPVSKLARCFAPSACIDCGSKCRSKCRSKSAVPAADLHPPHPPPLGAAHGASVDMGMGMGVGVQSERGLWWWWWWWWCGALVGL